MSDWQNRTEDAPLTIADIERMHALSKLHPEPALNVRDCLPFAKAESWTILPGPKVRFKIVV